MKLLMMFRPPISIRGHNKPLWRRKEEKDKGEKGGEMEEEKEEDI